MQVLHPRGIASPITHVASLAQSPPQRPLLRALAAQVETWRRLRNGGSRASRLGPMDLYDRSGDAPKVWDGVYDFKRRPRRGCVFGASTPRATPEGSQAQDAIGKTELAVVVPMKSPLRGKQVFACY
jgi:hypothetical protein